jgi:hAT family C-terminal dimerisation region
MYVGLEEDFATDPDLLGHLATSKERLQVFFNTNYALRSRQSVSRQGSSTSVVSSGSPQKVNFTSRYQKKERVVINELDEYFKLPQEDFDTCEPLSWWRGRRSQFPRLYRLVIDIFSIPGKLCMIILHYNSSNMVQTRLCCCR